MLSLEEKILHFIIGCSQPWVFLKWYKCWFFFYLLFIIFFRPSVKSTFFENCICSLYFKRMLALLWLNLKASVYFWFSFCFLLSENVKSSTVAVIIIEICTDQSWSAIPLFKHIKKCVIINSYCEAKWNHCMVCIWLAVMLLR